MSTLTGLFEGATVQGAGHIPPNFFWPTLANYGGKVTAKRPIKKKTHQRHDQVTKSEKTHKKAKPASHTAKRSDVTKRHSEHLEHPVLGPPRPPTKAHEEITIDGNNHSETFLPFAGARPTMRSIVLPAHNGPIFPWYVPPGFLGLIIVVLLSAFWLGAAERFGQRAALMLWSAFGLAATAYLLYLYYSGVRLNETWHLPIIMAPPIALFLAKVIPRERVVWKILGPAIALAVLFGGWYYTQGVRQGIWSFISTDL